MIATSLFLLPNGTFVVEVVVVLAILWVMKNKVLPILNKSIAERQDKIRTALEAADHAQAQAAAAGDEREKILSAARDQAREIVASAQATSDQIKSESGTRGQAEYDRILANADSEVAQARQRAIDEASAKMGEIVFELVAKIVGREVDQNAHQELVREAVASLVAEAKGSNK
ncbi:MAG: F0F1 ATP synthase subunit B [Actinomycetota bacterium]